MNVCIFSAFEDSMLKQTGGSVRIFNLSKGLASLGNDVVLVIPKYDSMSEKVGDVKIQSFSGFFPRRLLELLSKIMGAYRPTSLFFYDLLFIRRAHRMIRQSDLVQFEQLTAGALLIPFVSTVFKKPVVFDCHDTFQALRVKNTTILRKLLETFIEKQVYRFADFIVVVSEEEKQYLLSLGIGEGRISVIPNGVDTEYFQKSNKIEYRKKDVMKNFQTVIFVGNMSYAPNQEAIRLLSSKIAPRVSEKIKDVKFLAVGKLNEQISLPGIEFTGFVDNLPEVLCYSDVAVAPLLHGSGTRLKILEYFSCSLPVVSTSIGAEGLAVENGIHVLIEDDFYQFASQIVKLLNDKSLSKQLGNAARQLVVENYDWAKIACRLNDVYKKTLASLN